MIRSLKKLNTKIHTKIAFETSFLRNFVEFDQRRTTNGFQNIRVHPFLISTVKMQKQIERYDFYTDVPIKETSEKNSQGIKSQYN